jgi:2-amino-4-hydroxy-6-hydroxymethyldihydropteridine diphosphokinase
MELVILSLGSNRGDRRTHIQEMVRRLSELLAPPVKQSRLMATEPVGVVSPDWFLNVLVAGMWKGTAQELLDSCQSIEKEMGRVRLKQGDPRTADIDILLFGSQMIQTPELVVPHPEIVNRRFCLTGLAQIDAEIAVPGLNKTVRQLVEEMPELVRRQGIRFMSGK